MLGFILGFFLDFLSLFLDRGEGKENERERNISVWFPLLRPLLGNWPAIQACALTGNQTWDLSVRRPALHPLSHTSQSKSWHFEWWIHPNDIKILFCFSFILLPLSHRCHFIYYFRCYSVYLNIADIDWYLLLTNIEYS